MSKLSTYFFRGLAIVVPIVLTVYVLYVLVTRVDRLLNLSIPGLGIVITLGVILLVGFLASSFLTRWFFDLTERILTRVPFVKLVYSSVRDLTNAFFGEQKRFNHPVRVLLDPATDVYVLGFITQEDVSEFGAPGFVAVYLPQSYNFAGSLIFVRADRVFPVEKNPGDVMTFIVSAGISKGS